MSLTRAGWMLFIALLTVTSLAEGHGQGNRHDQGHGQGYQPAQGHRYQPAQGHRYQPKPDPSLVNGVNSLPSETQQKLFKNMIKDTGLQMKPSGGTNGPLGDIVGAIAGGIGNTFFPGNPIVSGIINELVVGGFDAFMGIFSKPKPPPPNMPPVITCPKSITRNQDRGQIYATVTWDRPRAFDVEDGEITNLQDNGIRPGNRYFAGDNVVKYRVTDSEGRNDFCSFYVTVKLIKCPPIKLLPNSVRTTCRSFQLLDDTCDFYCVEGYALKGSPRLTCTSSGGYDRDYPTCSAIECGKPELPKGGERWDCSDDYNYDSRCTAKCAEGFRIDSDDRTPWDTAMVKCQANGTWTRSPVCKDVSAPSFRDCPNTIKRFADRGKTSTEVKWDDIRAFDSSGSNVTVTQIKGLSSGSVFETGPHEIRFEAINDVGLKETCAFYVNVETRSCSVPKFSHPFLDINCHNQFLHGSACDVTCKYGVPLQGADRITCEVDNGNMTWTTPGGNPTCLDKPCPSIRAPPNANLVCSDIAGGKSCFVSCEDGFIPARNAAASRASCSPATGVWTNLPLIGCVRPRPVNTLITKFMFYWKAPCKDSDISNITATFDQLFASLDLSRCPRCRVSSVEVECRPWKTYKLAVVRWSVTYPVQQGDDAQSVRNSINGAGIEMRIGIQNSFSRLPVIAAGGQNKFKSTGDSVECDKPYQPNLQKGRCAACAPGYEFDGTDGCQMCPENTYQDDSGDATCSLCPEGTQTTNGIGKTDSRECRSPCPAGRYSRTGLTPCSDCSVRKYQNNTGSKSCLSCPKGEITPAMGSVDPSDCYQPASKVNLLDAPEIGPTSVKLTWVRPKRLSGQLLGFEVDYNDGNRSEPLWVGGNKTESKEIINLSPSTEYVFRVYAVTDQGRGSKRKISVTTKNASEITTTLPPPTTIDPTLCPPGTESPDGRLQSDGSCYPCLVDFYQQLAGQTSCLPCPSGTVTYGEGATQCWNASLTTTESTTTTTTTATPAVPCPSGHVSDTGNEPACRKCREGKVPSITRTKCKWCPLVGGQRICPPQGIAQDEGTTTTAYTEETTTEHPNGENAGETATEHPNRTTNNLLIKQPA